jgi:hypothetical protein
LSTFRGISALNGRLALALAATGCRFLQVEGLRKAAGKVCERVRDDAILQGLRFRRIVVSEREVPNMFENMA